MTALVSTDWLAEHAGDPKVALVEIDWEGRDAYEAGHIPGAIGWNWKDALWDPFERQFPSPDDFAARLGAAGIAADTTVVFYGVPVQFGAYAWWVFRICGHRDVRLLDGGRTKWVAEGRPLTQEVPARAPVRYAPGPRRDALRAGRQDVLDAIGSGGVTFLDHRSPEEYAGERVGVPGKPNVGAERAGRIPGARHLPHEALLNDDDTFRPREELRAAISAHVAAPDAPVISYCRLSHRAALACFAMTEILGHTNVRVYDGSWTEWGSLVGVPIER